MISKTIPGTFGFEVGTWDSGNDWYVQLPHQCDSWDIASYATREEAADELEKFLAEGRAALELLRNGTPEQFASEGA